MDDYRNLPRPTSPQPSPPGGRAMLGGTVEKEIPTNLEDFISEAIKHQAQIGELCEAVERRCGGLLNLPDNPPSPKNETEGAFMPMMLCELHSLIKMQRATISQLVSFHVRLCLNPVRD